MCLGVCTNGGRGRERGGEIVQKGGKIHLGEVLERKLEGKGREKQTLYER